MRVLIIVPSLLRAGAETQAVDLANGLAKKGHVVHICCFEQQLDQRCRLGPSIQFHHFLRRNRFDLSVARRLANVIDVAGIDVIQSVLQISTFYGWLAVTLSKRKPALVSAIHTTISRDRKEEVFTRTLYRALLGRVSTIIFVCNQQRDYWIHRFPELGERAMVIHNGVDPDRFRRGEFMVEAAQLRAELAIPESAFVFGSIAAFRPEKGHGILIDAFARLNCGPYLICAGDGVQRKRIEAKVHSIGLNRRVRFLGVVSDARPVIAASNATVLASTAVETFSMAMLESMCLGVPMIAPILGGLSEAIENGQNGLLFPAADVGGLATCMQSLVDDRAKCVRMGATAVATVRRSFTDAKMVAANESVLLQAASKLGH